jgi:hypothetical protein
MAPGFDGIKLMLIAWLSAALPPQALLAMTEIFPGLAPKLAVRDVVPCPVPIDDPPGTPHIYEVANGTAEMLYVTPVWPEQTVVGPVMAPGVAGIWFTVSEDGLLPDPVPVVTLIIPVLAPTGTVTSICESLTKENTGALIALIVTAVTPVNALPVSVTTSPIQAVPGLILVMFGLPNAHKEISAVNVPQVGVLG